MNSSIISIRYAKALLMVGNDNNCLDDMMADMELLGTTISENPMFRQILDNPVVKPPQKRKVMAELLEKRVHPMTLNFINLVIRNRREFILADMARNFIDLCEKAKGIKRAHVVTAFGIDDESKQHLKRQLNALFKADVKITNEVNPGLISGFIFRVGDQQYDASLSSALERMRKVMINS